MKWLIFIVIGVVLVITGITIGIYYFHEKPVAEQGEIKLYCNYSISAICNNEKMTTGFGFIDNFILVSSGTTLADSYTRVVSTANSTVFIYNQNLEDQRFYTNYSSITVCDVNMINRVDLSLIKYGNLSGISLNKLGDEDYINLSINVSGYVRGLSVCVKWPANIVTLDSYDNLPEEMPISRMKDLGVDKCYNLGRDYKDENFNLTFIYSRFSSFAKYDELDFYFIDSDYRWNNGNMQLSHEVNATDVGLEDYVVKVKA